MTDLPAGAEDLNVSDLRCGNAHGGGDSVYRGERWDFEGHTLVIIVSLDGKIHHLLTWMCFFLFLFYGFDPMGCVTIFHHHLGPNMFWVTFSIDQADPGNHMAFTSTSTVGLRLDIGFLNQSFGEQVTFTCF